MQSKLLQKEQEFYQTFKETIQNYENELIEKNQKVLFHSCVNLIYPNSPKISTLQSQMDELKKDFIFNLNLLKQRDLDITQLESVIKNVQIKLNQK